jgi:hypothetical protein
MIEDLKKRIEELEAQAPGCAEYEQRIAQETRRLNEMIERAVGSIQNSD